MNPIPRPRRLRVTPTMRRLVRETSLSVDDFIMPFFITAGSGVRRPVDAMPGISNLSVDQFLLDLDEVAALGLPGVLLFGLPEAKDACGSGASDDQGPVQEAIRRGKARHPELLFIADICLCEYTDHGHCGLVEDGRILNDETLPLLVEAALSCGRAGADIIAPSDMMDGRVGAIRAGLDAAGFTDIAIMAYSVKHASAFYGPFREAAQSAPAFGDRKTYQMDPANAREARRELRLDAAEGADILMVKPALSCLDLIAAAAAEFELPVAAYQVSGEYSMIKAAAAQGWINEKAAALEALTAIKRAGAKIIISYFALDFARWRKNEAEALGGSGGPAGAPPPGGTATGPTVPGALP